MKYVLVLLAACGGATAVAPVGNMATTESSLTAVLVVHPGDPGAHAYVLGCMRGGVSVAKDECSTLLVGMELEVVLDGGRVTYRATERGQGIICPAGEPSEPYVTLAGMPDDIGTPLFVVTPGLAVDPAPVVAPPAVQTKHGQVMVLPTKGPGMGPELIAQFQVDLDGDGTFELVTEELGQYTLYDRLGGKLGTVGCVFG